MRRGMSCAIAVVILTLAAGPVAEGQSAAAPSHLDQVIAALEQVSPQTEGTVWRDTTGNALEGDVTDWFLQTPNCWGSDDCSDPVGTRRLLAAIAEVIGAARHTVDITTLWPFADGGFQDAIVAGLRQALANGHRPIVRVVAGNPYFVSYTGTGPAAWRAELLNEIGPSAAALPIAVAVPTTNLQSWNHAKMVSVDGPRSHRGRSQHVGWVVPVGHTRVGRFDAASSDLRRGQPPTSRTSCGATSASGSRDGSGGSRSATRRRVSASARAR